MKIIRPRLKKINNPYMFFHAYKKKVAYAHTMMSASIAAGLAQINMIKQASFGHPAIKTINIAKATVSTFESMQGTRKYILGDNPYSFRDVYGQKMKRINA